jgi:hypothetical protein
VVGLGVSWSEMSASRSGPLRESLATLERIHPSDGAIGARKETTGARVPCNRTLRGSDGTETLRHEARA